MIFKSFEYKLEKILPKKRIWSCTYKNRTKCKALYVTYENTMEEKHSKHNHTENYHGSVKNYKAHYMKIIKRRSFDSP